MKPILKAECGEFSVRLHRKQKQHLLWSYPPWDFDGLLIYGFVAVWFDL